jgi:hypothetical protein
MKSTTNNNYECELITKVLKFKKKCDFPIINF